MAALRFFKMLACGIDSIGITRVALARKRTKGFDKNVFSEYEREYIAQRGSGENQTAAGIFAAKEAFLKAVGVGIFTFKLSCIEVRHTEHGRPFINLFCKLPADAVSYTECSLSITHHGDIATALVVLQ